MSRELKIGVVFIGVLALFIWGYNFMKGRNLFDGNIPTYFSEYKNVQGLNTASKVTINGYQVGKVQNIKFNPDPEKKGQLIVEFSMMEKEFEFSKNSVAKIYSDGLMGGKALAIIPSYQGEKAVSGDYLKGAIELDMFSSVGEKLNPLSSKVESVIVKADSLLLGINDIIDTPTRKHLKSSIAQFDQSMIEFKHITNSINAILAKNKETLETTLTNAKDITSKFSTLTDTLNKELQEAELAKTVKELQKTIKGINSLVANLDKGEGSLGKLLKDDKMYTNLTNASKELEELLREMKEHPKRFVHFSLFGKKDKSGYTEPVE
ncbi:MAG TPA: MCE family protein [Lutibacter sp.]|nr:MCE family protein [Lutibacter sp.]